MITEKAIFMVNPITGAPPSYESVTNEQAQGRNGLQIIPIFIFPVTNDVTDVDKKESWPEADTHDPPYAPPYASTSTPPKPTLKPDEKATMSERQCFESGGHVIPTIMFRPGGIAAMVVTVAAALWNKRPILCERCQKELNEEDFKNICERREELCKGKGPAKRGWKDRSRSSTKCCGQRKKRDEQGNERRERPRCGRSRRNSF
jgi:hypothetical protein